MAKKAAHQSGQLRPRLASTQARSEASWKAAQKRTQVNKKTKLAILALGLLFAVIFLGQAVRLTQSLFKSATPGVVGKSYLWNGSSNLNLVFSNETGVSVVSYNPDQASIKIAKLPESVYINVADGYGQWPLRSVFSLGQSENPPRGNQLLSKSISHYLGIPIDGFIQFKGNWTKKEPEEVVKLLQNPINIFSLSTLTTNLSPVELVQLVVGFHSVRFDKINSYNLAGLNLLDTITLADGSEVLSADVAKIDIFSQNFTEDKMVLERVSVTVLNATDTPGLASRAARLISNMGGNVIQQTNFNQKQHISQVVVDPKDQQITRSYTYKRLGQIFGVSTNERLDCQNKQKCDNINEIETRAQINVILGEDFY